MSYLKIYPKRIIANLNPEGDFKGRRFKYEVQHGLEIHETPGWVS